MFTPRYKELRIEPTIKAMRELLHNNSDLSDVVEVLENGHNCSPSQRAENIIEKCMRKSNIETRVVVAKIKIRYTDGFAEEVWRLIHFGIVKVR